MRDANAIIEFIMELADMPIGLNVDANTSLFSAQLLDSITLVELIAFLEDTFSIKVRPMEISLDNFDSVSRILAYIDRKRDDLD